MNHIERFRAVMNCQKIDRLPRIEWAMWWDKTITRWKSEGLPNNLKDVFEISQFFGLDPYIQFWISTTTSSIAAEQHHVEGAVSNMDDYLRVKKEIFPDHKEGIEAMRPWARMQERGEAVVWITLEGFFWLPRTLLGIEKQMYSFYDDPPLIHRINQDLLDYHIDVLHKMSRICRPTFLTFAEDMSYNHGPMLSKTLFDEFLAPYYSKLIPVINDLNIIPIIDTDGDVTEMIPWLREVGIVGVLPLERQAGVDGMKIRQSFADFGMIGHFDKMVMNRGEDAIRAEFERLMPLMKTGGFIPSVDHQTPPGVSLAQYRTYLKLLDEYTRAAAN